MAHICKKCKVPLNKKNWFPAQKKNYDYKCKECGKKEKKQRRADLKLEIISAYGGKCACCKCNTIEFLTIDHIDGTGAEHRKKIDANIFYYWLKKNNYPQDNFQLLCFNCNCAKGIYGACPHQQKSHL